MKEEVKIGDNIKKYRKNKKMTQEQLSKEVGISKNGLWNYENNVRDVPASVLNKIADVLRISTDDLLGAKPVKYFPLGPSAQTSIMIRNERFDDNANGIFVTYEIKLYKEEEPAILTREEGLFFIDIKIVNDNEEVFFKLKCSYVPSSHRAIYAVDVSIYPAVDIESATDQIVYYDSYTKNIDPELYEHLLAAIENTIKVYFYEVTKIPFSVEVYHNFF